ncbi:hypothetical protein C8Q75DRAFT_307611 [Abortiporus biennis]|nr:hypothetical protein C8Q75DRAFT_307611 [Abortiporus biennis]
MDPRKREIFMGVPAVRDVKEKSFEEQRIEDYLIAYRSSGRPPAPVPQEPPGVEQRRKLGLPPLFQPHIEVGQSSPLPSRPLITPIASLPPIITPIITPKRSEPMITDLNAIPAVQVFTSFIEKEENTNEMIHYQCIVCDPKYSHFSVEELRYQAYRTGKTHVPEAVNSTPQPQGLRPTLSLASVNGQAESFQSISCTPPYAHHSHEELRVAFLRSGRPMTSEEIIRSNSTLRLTV